MTAIATQPIRTSDDALLRFLVRVDATLTSSVGLLLAASADYMSGITGFTVVQEWIIGSAFVGYGLLLFVLASVEDLRVIGTAVVAGNVIFTITAVVAVLAGAFALTGFGVAVTLATAAVTLILADLQYLGVRRIRA